MADANDNPFDELAKVASEEFEKPFSNPFVSLSEPTEVSQGYKEWDMTKPSIICDGCNVRAPFEHRCHGRNAYVMGERTGKACECQDCAEDESLKWAAHPTPVELEEQKPTLPPGPTTKQLQDLKDVLKNAGADSNSQEKALVQIKSIVWGD